jgi:hypothetical protein
MKVMGLTGGTMEVGEKVTRARDAKNGDYTPVYLGRIVREATEQEWLAANPNCADGLKKYPESKAIFTFEHYYIYE